MRFTPPLQRLQVHVSILCSLLRPPLLLLRSSPRILSRAFCPRRPHHPPLRWLHIALRYLHQPTTEHTLRSRHQRCDSWSGPQSARAVLLLLQTPQCRCPSLLPTKHQQHVHLPPPQPLLPPLLFQSASRKQQPASRTLRPPARSHSYCRTCWTRRLVRQTISAA